MEKLLMGIAMAAVSAGANGETVNFDNDKPGALPGGWHCGVTGRGKAKWTVEADTTAPSAPNVLKQSGVGSFPWCVKKDVVINDGFVEVKFKALSGAQDQAGGVMWRWKDSDNYYVARVNALENNISLYYTEKGSRNTIKYVDTPEIGHNWHTLRAEFVGTRIRVLLDSKAYIELDDKHIATPGSVGVWTKADSVTVFDDFSFGAAVKK